MGDIQAGQNSYVFLLAGITVLTCAIAHFIYKLVLGRRKEEAVVHETETETGAPEKQETAKSTATDKPSNRKTKKLASWSNKTEFSHPWLLKNLKGHPGTVLHVDFSANGKFMAATCDEPATMDPAGAAARRRKPRVSRERRRPPAAPPTPSTPQGMTIPPTELMAGLQQHVLTQERMWALGYPVQLQPNQTKVVVYINPPPRSRNTTLGQTAWDVNAPEFVPGGSQSDSGCGSSGSSPRSDSDEEADTVKYICARCDKMFKMTREGEYMSQSCVYHYGRIGLDGGYTCCHQTPGTRGCTSARYHVWNGTRPGMNGPLEGYVRARSRRGGIYALDAEMVYTTAGLELASIVVIGVDNHLVYQSLVKPSSPVVDCNTRFSGIRQRDLARATKTLRDVQNDILGFVGTDTILIGHALDNDLRALKLLHEVVVDTCAMYPHARGFPYRRSLRALCEELLGHSIQLGSAGHSPFEDARAAMDLAVLKVKNERAEAARTTHPISMFQPYDPLINSA